MATMSPELLALIAKQKQKYTNNNSRTISPKEGRNVYRILSVSPQKPWKRAAEMPVPGQFWRDLGVHWIKPAENAKPIAVVGSTDVVYDQPSALSIAIDQAIAGAYDEDTKKLYESWKVRKSVLVNVIDISDRANSDPQILQLTGTTWGMVLDIWSEWYAAGKDITDPVEGMDLVITRTGKMLNTQYTVQPSPTSSPLSPSVLDRAQDLDDFIESNYFKGEEQKALNFISTSTGTVTPLLAPSGARTPTAALTSSAASVAAEVAPIAAAVHDPVAAQRAALEAQLAALGAAPATAPVPVVAGAPVAPAVAPEPVAVPGALSSQDEAAILAELEGLIA